MTPKLTFLHLTSLSDFRKVQGGGERPRQPVQRRHPRVPVRLLEDGGRPEERERERRRAAPPPAVPPLLRLPRASRHCAQRALQALRLHQG